MFLNKVILVGYVGMDPEVRYIKENMATATFSLATTQPSYRLRSGAMSPERTDWHRIVTYGEQALFCEKFVRKGHLLMVEGRVSYRKYSDKNNVMHSVTEIVAERVGYVGNHAQEQNKNIGS